MNSKEDKRKTVQGIKFFYNRNDHSIIPQANISKSKCNANNTIYDIINNNKYES